MAKERVLITVKTYPTLSNKYGELVCTAGFREDGSWIRIYLIPFRKLELHQRYSKWQWIEMDLVRNLSDPRKESYRPYDMDQEIILGDIIKPNKDWSIRKNIALKNVKYNMQELINEAQNPKIGTSLAVLKPKEIIEFKITPCEREWNKKKLEKVKAQQMQGSLFDADYTERLFKIAKKLPYKFSYVFTTEDGQKRDLMIEDWEIGQLYWNCLKTYGNEKIACEKVREQYWDNMVFNKDLYFFLGTTQQYHAWSTNPFIIIGLFYPPKPTHSLQLAFDF